MSIKQNGGVFGRNPTFNDVTIDGTLDFTGDIDISSDLKVDGDLNVTGTTTLAANTFLASSSTVNMYLTGGDGNSKSIIFRKATGPAQIAKIGAIGNDLRFTTGSTEAVRMDSSQNVSILAGNLVIGTSGKGIDFSATAGTGTSELLDDYEEGTWTPTITPVTGSFTTLTYSNNTGYYTKVGRLVTVQFNIFTSNVNATGASGGVQISGLPFTVGADNYAGSISGMYKWTFAADRVGPVMISAISGGTSCTMYKNNVNSATADKVDVTDLQSGSGGFRNAIIGTVTYAV
tara:strand:+ start:2173 stop:3039 length:867 start_codon:yes stop_codon:yes gene_type:complete